jgi:hypothetical protein
MRDLDLADREDAVEWLTFLRALGLVAETDRGFERRRDPDRDALAATFCDRVFGAREVLDALSAADAPLTVDEAFGRVRDDVPDWERNRHADWERTWRDRVRRLLGWAALFGLTGRTTVGGAVAFAPARGG